MRQVTVERASDLVPCSNGHPTKYILLSRPRSEGNYHYLAAIVCTPCGTDEEVSLQLKDPKGFQVS